MGSPSRIGAPLGPLIVSRLERAMSGMPYAAPSDPRLWAALLPEALGDRVRSANVPRQSVSLLAARLAALDAMRPCRIDDAASWAALCAALWPEAFADPRRPDAACLAAPGSAARVATLRQRVKSSRSLWHPSDRVDGLPCGDAALEVRVPSNFGKGRGRKAAHERVERNLESASRSGLHAAIG